MMRNNPLELHRAKANEQVVRTLAQVGGPMYYPQEAWNCEQCRTPCSNNSKAAKKPNRIKGTGNRSEQNIRYTDTMNNLKFQGSYGPWRPAAKLPKPIEPYCTDQPNTSFTLAPMVAGLSTTWMPHSRITFFLAAALSSAPETMAPA